MFRIPSGIAARMNRKCRRLPSGAPCARSALDASAFRGVIIPAMRASRKCPARVKSDRLTIAMRTTVRIATILLAALAALSPSARAQTGDTGPEGSDRVLFDAANRERAARRLPQLRWDAALAHAARDHALLMARTRTISHQFPGEQGLSNRLSQAGARFTLAAENVGDAVSAQELHDAWMRSPPHRANLLHPEVDAVGIAVVERNGLFWGVQDFGRMVPNLSFEEQE